jgi:hypothetical protein
MQKVVWRSEMLKMKIAVTLVVLAGLVAVPRSATAGCSSAYWDCAAAAYKNPSFWSWYAAQIDCELDYVECVRIAMLGR